MEAKYVGTKLIIGGYLYVREGKSKNEKLFWERQRYRSNECRARAITADIDGNLVVYQGPSESASTHPENHNECTAEKVKARIKRKATEHPEKLLLRK